MKDLAFVPVFPEPESPEEPSSPTEALFPSSARMLGMMLDLIVKEMKANRDFMAKALEQLANQPIPEVRIDLPKTEIHFPDAILNTLERPVTFTMPQPTPIEIEVEDE